MNTLAPVGIALLVLLIVAFLQLTPGVFAIFYHHALAKKSKKSADDLSLHFYLGVEIWQTIIFLSLYLILSFFYALLPAAIITFSTWFLAAVFLSFSVIVFFKYFKKPGMTLFISRKSAKSLIFRAENVKTRTDALLLGFTTGGLELPFTLPLFLAIFYLLLMSTLSSFWLIILYILASLLPLFTLHAFYKAGSNLAKIERLRIKNKPLIRLILSLAYLFIAFLIILLGAPWI